MAKWKLPEGRKPLTTVESADLVLRMHDKLAAGFAAGDQAELLEAARQDATEAEAYAEELEAKLATCKKYRDAYAECDRIGTQAVRDLQAKLAKAVVGLTQIERAYYQEATNPSPETIRRMAARMNGIARDTQNAIAELKGKTDE